MASISQIVASIMQLQLTVIYFKLRRTDGLKQRNIHIKVRRNQSNDSKIEGGHTDARARAHIQTQYGYLIGLSLIVLF